MKIGFINRQFGNKSGVYIAALDFLYALNFIDADLYIFSHFGPKFSKNYEDSYLSYKKYIKLPRKKKIPKFCEEDCIRRLGSYFLSKMQNQLRRFSNFRKELDIIIVNGIYSHSLFLNNKLYYTKAVIVLHEDPDHYKFKNLKEKQFIDYLHVYDYFIFVSNKIKEKWISEYPVFKNKKTFLLYNCCKEKNINKILLKNKYKLRKEIKIEAKSFLAVCIGTIQERKGQDVIINNFDEIIKSIPNIKLLLIGRLSSRWAIKLKNKVNASWMKDYVTFTGHSNQALKYIYAADAFILPSRAEALPIVILEAMALRTPIIASNVGGIPEMIENGKDGILIDVDNQGSLANALLEIKNHKNNTKNCVENAYNKYWNKFSRQHQVDRLKNIIQCINKDLLL